MEWFHVGRIVNTHGIAGEVRVMSDTDFASERFTKGQTLYIRQDEASKPKPYEIFSHRKHKQFDLIKFVGFNTINDVQQFKGATLCVNQKQLSPLTENEFYYHQIIGCEVKTDTGDHLGKVSDVLSTGANDVWVIEKQGKDLLIPYIEDVVKQVDPENKLIVIHLIDGLID